MWHTDLVCRGVALARVTFGSSPEIAAWKVTSQPFCVSCGKPGTQGVPRGPLEAFYWVMRHLRGAELGLGSCWAIPLLIDGG